jgi:hypothetical protein
VGATLAVLGLAADRVYATSTATLNIDIYVNASAAIQVDTLVTSTAPGTGANGIAWTGSTRRYSSGDNASGIVHSSATVTNNGVLTERWYLSTVATSEDQGAAGSWSLVNSTNTNDIGQNQFALQAVFASSATTSGGAHDCPASASAIWGSTATLVMTPGPAAGDTGNAYGAKGASNTYDNYVYKLDPMNVCPDTGCSSGHYQMYGNATLPTGSGTRALCWSVILPPTTTTTDNQIIPLIVSAQAL